jgi:cytochrome c peroxidase
MGGTDNLATSIGHNWQQGPINSPTVLNSSMNLAQFWDGRAKDLKAQAGGPIANPGEMAFTHELAVDLLNSIPAYKAEFKQVFGKDSASIDMVTDAIAAFEETLVTPHSRFDKWLKGEKKALSAQEKEGYTHLQEQRLHGLPLWPGRRRLVLPEDGPGQGTTPRARSPASPA